MNNRKLFASVVALLIVMQCLCTPISYALGDTLPAEQPSFYRTAGEAIPVYEALNAAEAGEGGFAAGHYRNFHIGYGRPIVGEDDHPASSGRRFAYEGSTVDGGGIIARSERDNEGIIYLPTGESLGRIPDVEFDGWYIYGGDDYTEYNSWTYNAARDIAVAGSSDLSYSEYKVNADTTVFRLKVNDATAPDFLDSIVIESTSWGNMTYRNSFTFPLVAGWKTSSNATATSAALTVGGASAPTQLYLHDDNNKNLTVAHLRSTDFEPNITEYYLRVDNDAETLSLDLEAFEPFLDFQSEYASFEQVSGTNNRQYAALAVTDAAVEGSMSAAAASPVQITVNGAAYYTYDGVTLEYEATNDGIYASSGSDSIWQYENSTADPARSTWKLAGIPLAVSNGDEPYNEIKVTITAPDGEVTETYTFYVQRMADPAVAEFEPGNTPAGMIARDPDDSWKALSDDTNDSMSEDERVAANKASWLDFFTINRYIRRTGLTIQGYKDASGYNVSNSGILYDGAYLTDAWGTAFENPALDLDLDPTAIVAYQNYRFVDPGLTIITSTGTIHDDGSTGGTPDGGVLQRRIKLDVPANGLSLFEALAGEALDSENAASYVQSVYYVDGVLTSTDTWEKVTLDDLSVDLTDMEILPGVYSIEYRFIDPYSTPASEEQYLYFERPLVLLAVPGDVDMDGTTTVADAYALKFLQDNDFFAAPHANDRTALFIWRVCNVESTMSANVYVNDVAADIAALEGGWRPQTAVSRVPAWAASSSTGSYSVSDYIYPPLNDPNDRYHRKEASGTVGEPLLSIEYLGKQGKLPSADVDEGGSANTVGETASAAVVVGSSTAVKPTISGDTTAAVTNGDIFWVEVDVAAIEGYDAIQSFTFSLVYDGRYVRPATMTDMDTYAEFDETDSTIAGDFAENGEWAAVANKYNLRPGSGTVWATTGAAAASYQLTAASKPDGVHSTHFSRATSGIETTVRSETNSYNSVGELTFSIKLRNNGVAASLASGGTILRMPFIMHTYPLKEVEGGAEQLNLVSLDLGMQEFVVVNGAPASRSRAVSYAPTVEVSAYSTQEAIYGDETANIREQISLKTIECLVPMAENETTYAELKNELVGEEGENAKYGVAFQYTDSLIALNSLIEGQLPPGLHFDSPSGYIEGTPTEAGVYSFRIGNGYYQITVEKAPLRIYSMGGVSYYGENDFTDAGYARVIGDLANYDPNGKHAYELRYGYYTEDLIVGTSLLDDKGATAHPDDDDVYVFEGGASSSSLNENNDGSMEMLAAIFGDKIEHPTVKSGRAANSGIDSNPATDYVDGYPVVISGIEAEAKDNFTDTAMLDNYYFVVTNNPSQNMTRDSREVPAEVVVLPRPIIVETLHYDTDGDSVQDPTKLAQHAIADTTPPELKLQTAVLDKDHENFSIAAAKEPNANLSLDGERYLYTYDVSLDDPNRGAYPLSTDGYVVGDELSISYNVTVHRNETDRSKAIAPLKYFVIEEGKTEPRDLVIDTITIVDCADKDNYSLTSSLLGSDVNQDGTNPGAVKGDIEDGALVSSVKVTAIVAEWGVMDLDLVYGDRLALAGNISAKLEYESGEQPDDITYYGTEEFAEALMYLSIVTEDRMNWEIEQITAGKAVGFGNETGGVSDVSYRGDGVVVEVLDENTLLEATGTNKWYIRVAYAQEVDGELVIYKTDYSRKNNVTTPLTVAKKTLTLTVNADDRYYGETNDISYTFRTSDLVGPEANRISGQTPSDGNGSPALLLKAFGYADEAEWIGDGGTPPELFAVAPANNAVPNPEEMPLETFKGSAAVDRNTPHRLTSYYAGISGAEHKNYTFVYNWRNVTDQSVHTSDSYGYDSFAIHQRPIVLDRMPSGDLATVYSDITDLILEGLSYSTDDAGLAFAIPASHSQNATIFYDKSGNRVTENYVISGDAIVEGDKLYIKAAVELLADNVRWNTLNNGHFNMLSGGATVESRQVNAVLRSVELDQLVDSANNSASNYKLVFDSDADAANAIPKTATVYNRTTTGNGTKYTYTPGSEISGPLSDPLYVVGTAKVCTRPIVGITLTTPPSKTSYVYGEQFTPNNLTVTLTMETTHGDLSEITAKSQDGETIGTDTITFAYSNSLFNTYGLSISLKKANGSEAAVSHGEMMTPGKHDGGYIVVSGRRIAAHKNILSYSGESYKNAAYMITVSRRPLTLYVVNQYRYFGEENYSVRFTEYGNAKYEYYFNLSDLIASDVSKVTGSGFYDSQNGIGYGYIGANASNDRLNSALATLDPNFTPPRFDAEATAASPVEYANGYAITMSDAVVANYEISYVGGSVRVYPRPIRVTGYYAAYSTDSIEIEMDGEPVETTADRSIYTFLSATGTTEYSRTLPYIAEYGAPAGTKYTVGIGGTGVADLQPNIRNYRSGTAIASPIDGWQWFDVASAARIDTGSSYAEYSAGASGYSGIPSYAKFYLTSAGIIGDDNPIFNVSISVKPGNLSTNPTVADATVTGIASSGGNYRFMSSETGTSLPAAVDTRTIASIDITRLPYKLLDAYTYGEALELGGLVVRINYATNPGETSGQQPRYVYYEEGFENWGLYVNYYDVDEIPALGEEFAGIVTDYRPAASGDHLTIAPVHDGISLSSKPTTWHYGSFAANNKYIIISGKAPDTDLFVTPRMIRSRTDSADPTLSAGAQQIKVAPKVLEYNLVASDKDYDGTTRAVGSIEFANVYAGDLIYAATGRTDYEGGWKWYEGDTTASAQRSALQAMADGGYVFPSGSVATKSGDINDSMTYTHANTWDNGTLTFEFVDADVYYGTADDTAKDESSDRWDEWDVEMPMNVEVTDIILGGPDAANYTFIAKAANETPVHEIDVTAASNPTAHVIPQATITRADRVSLDRVMREELPDHKLPQLQIDDKTGVVRLLYDSKSDEVVAAAKTASAAERKGRTGVDAVDNYDDELHIEYAIEFFLPDGDGNILAGNAEQYRGPNGYDHNGGWWQDTYYFGGEAVSDLYGDGLSATAPFGSGKFHISSDGFVVEEEEPEEMSYDSELVGQLYKWTTSDARINPSATIPYTFEGETSTAKLIQYLEMDEDDNLLPRETEWHFDDGFVFHVADTSTEARVIEIDGESYYYFYGYYTTDRDPIPRGAYVLGKVRIAATHNYNASEPLYTHGGSSVTQDELDNLVATAKNDAKALADYISTVAENDREDVGAAPVPSEQVVKMYDFRLDLRYAEDMDSADDTDEATYDFRVLRAVQFTDYTPYIEQEQLDAVVYNDIHSHYSGYFWDDRYQNSLEFDEEAPIHLGVQIGPLEVDRDLPDGSSVTYFEYFNNSNTIPIYVEIDPGNDLIPERWIDIKVELLEFYEDDAPFDLSTLEVEFYPPRHHRLELKWTSSDESVVRITADGMLEIVGVGSAVLTATSFFEKTDTITVIIHERPEPPVEPPKQTGVFNHELLAEFLGLDKDYFFYPEREMTRGELVLMASMFFIANDSWTRQEAIEFIDIVGDEPYAEAVTLLSEWGIIVGVGGDRFAGERIASRAEAAAILARMLGVEPAHYIDAPTFSDSTVHDTWAAGYIAALRALGATNGIGDNLFAPNRGITRAEAAAMFTRLLNHQIPSKQYVVPADVAEDHWAFGHIVRAVNNVILPAKLESEAESGTETEE